MEDKKKTETPIRVITRKEHLTMLRNSIMSKYINDEMDSAIWAGELAKIKDGTDEEARTKLQQSFDGAQGIMIKRQVAMQWIDDELAKIEKEGE